MAFYLTKTFITKIVPRWLDYRIFFYKIKVHVDIFVIILPSVFGFDTAKMVFTS